MALVFEKASCVVVGTFNMYILTPPWLHKHEVIASDQELDIEFNLAQPGIRYRARGDGTVWTVSPQRVAVESTQPDVDCGAKIARILEALPETPLIAIGNNASYMADAGEVAQLADEVRTFPLKQSPGAGETVDQRTFHVAVKRQEFGTTNLQLAVSADKCVLSCNAHLRLEGREDANAAAIQAAQRFFDDRVHSESLMAHFFGAQVAYDRAHT